MSETETSTYQEAKAELTKVQHRLQRRRSGISPENVAILAAHLTNTSLWAACRGEAAKELLDICNQNFDLLFNNWPMGPYGIEVLLNRVIEARRTTENVAIKNQLDTIIFKLDSAQEQAERREMERAETKRLRGLDL